MATFSVGLTGGIASGKSTVGRLMAEAGWTVVDADRLVAELYGPGQPGAEAVSELFGSAVLADDGRVDHAALAAIVFEDPEARGRLESAIHPLVRQRFFEIASAAEGIAVFEATLLAESGMAERFDRVVTVEAEPETRIQRAVDRGLSEQQARQRFRAQGGRSLRTAAADFVIENDGTLAQLAAAVAAVVVAIEDLDVLEKPHTASSDKNAGDQTAD